MYKLICSDIDGTLLNSERQVSPFTIQVVKKLPSHLPFVLISARMPKAMRHIQMALGVEESPLVCYNGGLVLHNDKVLSSTVISASIAHEVAELVHQKDLHLGMFHNDEWYFSKMDEWAEREHHNTKVKGELRSSESVFQQWEMQQKEPHKLMCMGHETKVHQVYETLLEKFPNELHLYRSKPTYIEIAPRSISKFTGIMLIAKQVYQLTEKDIVAYGDNYNDVSLLAGVGLGVAVANAVAPAKAVAKEITLAGKEDGVAHHLKNLFQL